MITLQPGPDDKLIEFFSAVPRRYQGAAIQAALRNGGLDAGRDAATAMAAQEAILAAQERAEIEDGLGSLGNQWDQMQSNLGGWATTNPPANQPANDSCWQQSSWSAEHSLPRGTKHGGLSDATKCRAFQKREHAIHPPGRGRRGRR